MDGVKKTHSADGVPAAPRFRRSPDGRLHLLSPSGPIAVRLQQCFPWSDPNRFYSLRNDDDEEVALIEDPSVLDLESRQALDEALREAGFVLEVVRVLDVDEEIEIRHWTVETRQGPRTFQTHRDAWPRDLPGGGMLIRDVAGDLYHLANPKTMDKRTRELLWSFVD